MTQREVPRNPSGSASQIEAAAEINLCLSTPPHEFAMSLRCKAGCHLLGTRLERMSRALELPVCGKAHLLSELAQQLHQLEGVES